MNREGDIVQAMPARRKWLRSWIFGFLAVALAATACGGSGDASPEGETPDAGETSPTAASTATEDAPDSDEPYRVLMIFGLSGPVAPNAEAEVEAIEAAADVLNEQGGILGRSVEVEVIDTETDPTKAVTLLQQRLEQGEPPDFVWPGITSNETLAMAPTLTEHELVSFTTRASADLNQPDLYPYMFGTQPLPSHQGQAFAEYAQGQGAEKVAVFTANDAYGESIGTSYEEALEEAGLETVSERFTPTDLDMTAQLERLRAEDPDLLLFQGYGAPAQYILEGRLRIGWTDTPAVGSLSVTAVNSHLDVDPAALENVHLQLFEVHEFVPEEERSEAMTQMIEAVKAKAGEISQPIYLYSYAYDTLMVAAEAAEDAGTTEATPVVRAIYGLEPSQSSSWVTYAEYGWSEDMHFADPQTEGMGYVFAEATPEPPVDGMLPTS